MLLSVEFLYCIIVVVPFGVSVVEWVILVMIVIMLSQWLIIYIIIIIIIDLI